MIQSHRRRFNREFSSERYAAFVSELEQRCGGPIDFRLSETPCFMPASLMSRLAGAAHELLGQLLHCPDYRAAADAVAAAFRLSASEPLPTFAQVDFGLIQTPSGIEGRLVELQAFPSLYGFQVRLGELSRERYGFRELTPYLDGLDEESYVRAVGQVIVGAHDPAEVVLLEIDPEHQKTRPDFAATEQLWGVRAVDVSEIEQRGRRLYAKRDGRLTPVSRIYNRVIPDELVRRGLTLPFDPTSDLDVEWAGGPDWFFRISKFSIPWLRHPWVPSTHYLDELSTLPDDRENWVLKPLFSFAGGGILFAPTDADIAAIPESARHDYILQERVRFTPLIDTPHGPTQVELRIMMIREGEKYRAVLPLARMGRGRMMGVDHNKELSWVGAAAVLIDQGE
ncbi:MAG TPA: hypothetical protein VES67_23860 [Vicinamibacterales bacterium]|nr:hypothetical protein [Vicinamibacterales bacterium]